MVIGLYCSIIKPADGLAFLISAITEILFNLLFSFIFSIKFKLFLFSLIFLRINEDEYLFLRFIKVFFFSAII